MDIAEKDDCKILATFNGYSKDEELRRYQDSVNKLNELETVFYDIKTADQEELRKHRLTYTMNMCKKLGLQESDFKDLNIIHMTGTKGKGSTCAFIESILRKSGYRTGLFSSPHLIEVTERMKINGEPLNFHKYTEYFEYCYDLLVTNRNGDDFEEPTYFQFLTCMMFYVFSREKVQAAIIEVGIGGEFDFTNIIPNPVACGMTSLGLDHCSMLGHTVEEIAWQKAGIFKPSCAAFTIKHESESVMDVLKKRAEEKNAPLALVPIMSEYKCNLESRKIKLGLYGNIQYLNSSLALQIAKYWLDKMNNKSLSNHSLIKENTDKLDENGLPILKPVVIEEHFKKGLASCFWPGRNQIIKSANEQITYYMDGAHTVESINQFVEWFREVNPNSDNEKNVLLFNYTGERDVHIYMKLLEMKFDAVAISKLKSYPKDLNNSLFLSDNFRKTPMDALDNDDKYINLVKTFLEIQHIKFDENNNPQPDLNYKMFENVFESLMWLTNGSDETLLKQVSNFQSEFQPAVPEQPQKVNVLITGSLYLVGLALKVLGFKIKAL